MPTVSVVAFHCTSSSLFTIPSSAPEDKPLNDSDTLGSLDVKDGARIYFKDLGPQIAWKTVSTEYRELHLFLWGLIYIL